MSASISSRTAGLLTAALLVAAVASGCAANNQVILPAPDPMPRELTKTMLPEYVIEPPDILQIDALSVIPLPPYRIKPLDAIGVRVPGALPDNPIEAVYPVETDGTVNLGLAYGKVSVAGLTLEEARAAIEKKLSTIIKKPETEVTLVESRGLQQIRGPHIVRQDGTVGLGQFGSVTVTGLTLAQAKAAIESHLSRFLKDPEVTVDILAFNSKVYYVILDGGGLGQQVITQPITGNETVLDAIGKVGGLGPVSDARRMWVARPGPDGCETILPVDWNAIAMRGAVGTNYQLMHGDRVFVQAYPLITLDSTLARILSPIERIFGVTLLGTSTVRNISGNIAGGGFRGF